jgi:hypothetical protein
MSHHNSFIQVPPDGAGKKVFTQQHTVGADTVQAHVNHIADPTFPEQIQRVDEKGQAYFRFAEGAISLDTFGNARVGEATCLAAYEYTNDPLLDLFQDKTVTGGSITWVNNEAKTTLATSGVSGASATRSTNRWHYYQPGVSNLTIITCYLNDNGKAGNTRRWGYFGIRNGLFFELEGATLNVVQRSWIGGSINETKIARENWNGDRVDGTGLSGMTLDLTKANFFWIDFAWLGVGISRFGVLAPDGSRVTCHVFQNPNTNSGAYMGRGSLPVRYENFNTTATAGTSELHLICTAVYASARTDYTFWRYSDIETAAPVPVTTDTYLLSMRPRITSAGGALPNRVGIYPESLNLFVTGGSVKISIIDDATLTDPVWQDCASLTQFDTAATGFAGGELFKTFYIGPGAHIINLEPFYETNDEGYHVLADWTDSYRFTLVATKLDGTTVNVMANLNYKELV